MKRGFTLIELLIFISIFSIIIVAFITILVAMVNLQTAQSASAGVEQQGQFLIQQVQYYIESARLVDMAQDVAMGTLTVREFNLAQDPTSIMASSGTAYLQQGFGAAQQPLTAATVSVSNLSFTRHYNVGTSSDAFGTDSVSFSFTLSATSTNNKSYVQSFQSAAATFAPVGKIALVQQASGTYNNPSVTGFHASYPTNVELGDLLIAVVANTTSSPSLIVSDSIGNKWTQIASTSYPAYNSQLTFFDATTTANTADTVNVTSTPAVGYAVLSIYEYRGASSSAPFDASSSQLQPNTPYPSSGQANATSAVELIFGADQNPNSAEAPSPGTGFTLEASSTVAQHLFIEDMVQYVTGPVAAAWQYTGSPSSTAAVVTFR